MAKASTTIRIDTQLKKRTQEIFKELGMDFTTGITIYLNKVEQCGGIPFDLVTKQPNHHLLATLDEDDNMEK